jgi:hypothetical protein
MFSEGCTSATESFGNVQAGEAEFSCEALPDLLVEAEWAVNVLPQLRLARMLAKESAKCGAQLPILAMTIGVCSLLVHATSTRLSSAA